MQLAATLVRDRLGTPLCLMAAFQDISELKRVEAALLESEANYRNLFDSATDGVFLLALDGRFIDANRTAYERLGYTREEFLALDIRKLDDPAFAGKVPERLRQIREQGVAIFESGHRRKDGTTRPVEVNSRLFDYRGKQVYFSVIRDITERKKAEDALLREKNKTDAVLAALSDGLRVQDREFRVLYQNDAHKALVGSHTGEFCYAAYQHSPSVCEHCALALAFEDGKVHTVERTRVKVEDEELRRIQADERLEVLRPELGTRPRVHYKNLHLMTKCFVGGTIVRAPEASRSAPPASTWCWRRTAAKSGVR